MQLFALRAGGEARSVQLPAISVLLMPVRSGRISMKFHTEETEWILRTGFKAAAMH